MNRTLLPEGWPRPRGYANGIAWYVVDKAEYLAALREIGAIWKERIGPHYPTMAVVEVKGLIEDAARIEIETTAVIG